MEEAFELAQTTRLTPLPGLPDHAGVLTLRVPREACATPVHCACPPRESPCKYRVAAKFDEGNSGAKGNRNLTLLQSDGLRLSERR
jgi:hypothetical protein